MYITISAILILLGLFLLFQKKYKIGKHTVWIKLVGVLLIAIGAILLYLIYKNIIVLPLG